MALQLNDQGNDYREFYGRYNDQMPQLLAEGRTPMSVAALMQRRLDVMHAAPPVRNAWLNNYFDTGDAILYHPNGKIKVVLDAPPLRTLTTESSLALLIDNDAYRHLSGAEFDRDEIITDTPLTKQYLLTSIIWKTLARDDRALLRAYADMVFSLNAPSCTENMDVYLKPPADVPRDTPVLRAWFVNSISCRSLLDGNYGLSLTDGRLVGMLPQHPSSHP